MSAPASLAKREESPLLPAEPLEKIQDVRAAFDRLHGKVNLVTPVASVDTIMALHRVSLRAVVIDPSVDAKGNGPEVYKGKFCSDKERALGKVALEKIMAAAGVQIISTRRMDDRSQPLYCEFEVTLATRDFDGTYRQATKNKAVDLRDGSAEASTLKEWPAVLAAARQHILSNCETKAGLRALRTLLTLKQKYTLDELSRPFAVPKLVPALDPADPEQKAALIAIASGGEMALFGRSQAGAAQAAARLLEASPSPTALPANGNPPPPVGAVPHSEEETPDEPEDLADFAPLSIPTPEPVAVCDCPCGDQAELTEEVARLTTDHCGAPRCKECYPGKSFNVAKHTDVKDLKLPKNPKLTVDAIARGLANMAAK